LKAFGLTVNSFQNKQRFHEFQQDDHIYSFVNIPVNGSYWVKIDLSRVEPNTFFLVCIYHAWTGLLQHWDHGFKFNLMNEVLLKVYYFMLSVKVKAIPWAVPSLYTIIPNVYKQIHSFSL
jgi:hypothetical protein